MLCERGSRSGCCAGQLSKPGGQVSGRQGGSAGRGSVAGGGRRGGGALVLTVHGDIELGDSRHVLHILLGGGLAVCAVVRHGVRECRGAACRKGGRGGGKRAAGRGEEARDGWVAAAPPRGEG